MCDDDVQWLFIMNIAAGYPSGKAQGIRPFNLGSLGDTYTFLYLHFFLLLLRTTRLPNILQATGLVLPAYNTVHILHCVVSLDKRFVQDFMKEFSQQNFERVQLCCWCHRVGENVQQRMSRISHSVQRSILDPCWRRVFWPSFQAAYIVCELHH